MKIKRTPLQRTSGIISIIFGSVQILFGLLMIGLIAIIRTAGDALAGEELSEFNSALGTATAMMWLYVAIALGFIVFGSLFCKSKKRLITPIALILLSVLSLVFGILLNSALGNAMDISNDASSSTGMAGGVMDYIGYALIVVPAILHLVMAKKTYPAA